MNDLEITRKQKDSKPEFNHEIRNYEKVSSLPCIDDTPRNNFHHFLFDTKEKLYAVDTERTVEKFFETFIESLN